MELCREILLALEEQYEDTIIYDLTIEGHDMKEVAYHCALLNEAGLIDKYNAQYANNELYMFAVGHLTWDGHEFLDKIRAETIWNRTKDVISGKGVPMALDVIKHVATSIIYKMLDAAL